MRKSREIKNFCGFRNQNYPRLWDQGSKSWVKIWDQLCKNIPRYDPADSFCTDKEI